LPDRIVEDQNAARCVDQRQSRPLIQQAKREERANRGIEHVIVERRWIRDEVVEIGSEFASMREKDDATRDDGACGCQEVE